MSTVTIPQLSPFPTADEQAGADLAAALVEWQESAPGADRLHAAALLRDAAEHYAAHVPDWFRNVPELHAAAGRARYAAEQGHPIETVAEHSTTLLDLVTTWEQDRSAERSGTAHDVWRGDA